MLALRVVVASLFLVACGGGSPAPNAASGGMCKDVPAASCVRGRTVVLVTHSPDVVAQHCNRCIVISEGRTVFDGSGKDGAEVYRKLF